MIPLLITVTLVALAMTLVLGFIVVRLLRDERRRSDARVAALSEMAAFDSPEPAPAATVTREDSARRAPERETRPPVRAEVAPRIADDFDLYGGSASMAGVNLFAVPERRSPLAARLGVAGVGVLVAAVAFGVIARRPASEEVAGRPRAESSELPTTGSLDLLSLQHEQKGDTLTITGMVQNPRAGAPLAKISVTAFLFAADGTFLASGRAPLDFTALAPGDESSFVLAIPVARPVTKYRIGFRAEDGRVIGHIDRREGRTMALNDK